MITIEKNRCLSAVEPGARSTSFCARLSDLAGTILGTIRAVQVEARRILRNPVTLLHFTDRSSWLALAGDTLFWRVSGTIVGTVRVVAIRRRPTSVLALGCSRRTFGGTPRDQYRLALSSLHTDTTRPELSVASSAVPTTTKLSGITVLVVDDDAESRELLTVTLESYGAGVVTAASAAEGWI
jgi:hypothetical protein